MQSSDLLSLKPPAEVMITEDTALIPIHACAGEIHWSTMTVSHC